MVGWLAVHGAIAHRRHGRDHRADLAPMLAAHELTLVSARRPGHSQVGPFPKIEIVVSRPLV